jgi:hypothetical protein
MIKAKRSHSIGRQVTESKMSQLGMLPRSGFVHLPVGQHGVALPQDEAIGLP